MKKLLTTFIALTIALLATANLFAQGPLPPTGAPGPTMKTLDQIEPRRPLIQGTAGVAIAGSGSITISQAGSYYLTASFTSTTTGISIEASNVTVDLNGYTISSAVGGNGLGIGINGGTGIYIHNGHIRGGVTYNGTSFVGSGFTSGISYGVFPVLGSIRVRDVTVDGVSSSGIHLGVYDSSIVESCVVNVAGVTGIEAGVVNNCAALVIGNTPFVAKSISGSLGKKANGTVTTPGAPIETRIAIQAGTVTYPITQAGSYVLTGNITVATGNGITISADDVTLDLNGFTIASTSPTASGDAISFSGPRSRIAISNGHIRSGTTYNGTTFTNGPGFNGGINWPSVQPTAVRVSGISIVGIKSFGIDLGSDTSSDASSIVQGCTVRIAGSIGIRANVVSDCSVVSGSTTTIEARRIANSVGARADGSGSGIVELGASSSLESIATTTNAIQTNVGTLQSTATTTQNTVNSVQTTSNTILAAAEKRTPIPASSSTVTLGTSGSYYLTGNIGVSSGNGVIIGAANVTLDLNGFTIASSSVTQDSNGILINGSARNVKITNGIIVGTTTGTGNSFSGGGFFTGIKTAVNANVMVRHVQVSGVHNGMDLAIGTSRVDNCMVRTCSNDGITAEAVRDTTVTDCIFGIFSPAVIGCTATQIFNTAVSGEMVDSTYASGGSGILADHVSNSTGNANSSTGNGINADVVTGSLGFATNGRGITANEVIANSHGLSFTGNGIYALDGVVSNSSGVTTGGGGTALSAFTATGSRGRKAGAVSQAITNKYNMP